MQVRVLLRVVGDAERGDSPGNARASARAVPGWRGNGFGRSCAGAALALHPCRALRRMVASRRLDSPHGLVKAPRRRFDGGRSGHGGAGRGGIRGLREAHEHGGASRGELGAGGERRSGLLGGRPGGRCGDGDIGARPSRRTTRQSSGDGRRVRDGMVRSGLRTEAAQADPTGGEGNASKGIERCGKGACFGRAPAGKTARVVGAVGTRTARSVGTAPGGRPKVARPLRVERGGIRPDASRSE